MPSRIAFVLAFACFTSPARSQAVLWTSQFGSGFEDVALAAAAAPNGGFVTCGYTAGTLGSTGAGFNDAWLAKYASDGAQIWIRQFGTQAPDAARALAVDQSGAIFVAGDTGGFCSDPASRHKTSGLRGTTATACSNGVGNSAR